jgi:hypothetical protein
MYREILLEITRDGRSLGSGVIVTGERLLYGHLLRRYPNGRHLRIGHGVFVSMCGSA